MMSEATTTRRGQRHERIDACPGARSGSWALADLPLTNRNGVPGQTSPRQRQSGFSLLEVMISLTIIAIALALLVSSMLALTHSRRQSNERHQVATVMSRALETLESMGPTNAYTGYAPAPDGTPFPSDGAGNADSFDIDGLQGIAAGIGATIQVSFVVDETENDPELGLPRDLDGDGEINNTNVAALDDDGEVQATILPVRLSANWRSFNGQNRTLTWSAMIVAN